MTKRRLKAVYQGRGAYDREALAVMAVKASYVVENDLRWTSGHAMYEEYIGREYTSYREKNKKMALNRCSEWCTQGACVFGGSCKCVHIPRETFDVLTVRKTTAQERRRSAG